MFRTYKVTYEEFLRTHSPGIYHVCVQPAEGYQRLCQFLAGGCFGETLIGGTHAGGMEFSYVDLTTDLGFAAELMDPPEDFVPPTQEDVNIKS
jgi:hypothetical protein